MYKYIEEELEDPRQGRDALGVITFEYFLKLYKTALIWNRVQFAEKKKLLITQRRKALQNNDMDSFRKCFLDMVSEDEKCLQGVLEEILDKISLSDNEFKETLNLYMSDKEYENQIREAMEDASVDR